MNECRICVKTNLTINLQASRMQQTLESQQAFPSPFWDNVCQTHMMSQSVSVHLLLWQLTKQRGLLGLERGEALLSKRIRSSDKEER